jgi:hypothetical protein
MFLLVNHLTRMRSPRICIAGLCAGRHVRPISSSGDLNFKLLRRTGGALAIGAVVDLGPVKACPKPPEIEDHEFKRWNLKFVRWASSTEFWFALSNIAKQNLRDVFGCDCHKHGSTCTVDPGRGVSSLGCVPLRRAGASLYIRDREGKGQVRLRFEDAHYGALDVGVTDIRLYEADLVTPNTPKLEMMNSKLCNGIPTMVAVGLSRPYTPKAFGDPVHWLQINNLHFEDEVLEPE